jgi:hypothetical protein
MIKMNRNIYNIRVYEIKNKMWKFQKNMKFKQEIRMCETVSIGHQTFNNFIHMIKSRVWDELTRRTTYDYNE